MNIYEFQDLSERSVTSVLPTETIVFNGINLDKELPYFRTLNVSGRENFERSLNTVETSGDGEFLLSSKLNANTIVVTFSLSADTTSDFNVYFDKLKDLLAGTNVPFSFTDEPNYTRFGTVSKLDNPTAGSIDIVGTIEIRQSDPYKYSDTINKSGTSSVTLESVGGTGVKLQRLVMTVKADTNTVTLLIGKNRKLVLEGSFKTGNDVTIDFENKTISSLNTSVLNKMKIPDSNLFEGGLQDGDVVSSENASNITVSFRGFRL